MQNFVSSNLTLEVGKKVLSIAAYEEFFQSQREQFKNAAMDSIYMSLESKESARIRAEMQKNGVVFVEHAKPDYSKAPEPFEIEAFETKPDMGGKVLVTLRKQRDEYSWTRLHVFEDELYLNYTGKTLDELIDRDLENVRSMWAIKAERLRAADQVKRTEQIVESSTDELGKAASVVAGFETATKTEQAELMQSTEFRNKFMAAKKVVGAARSFK
jgi:flagellar motility protein MotE (MotC chaperone)